MPLSLLCVVTCLSLLAGRSLCQYQGGYYWRKYNSRLPSWQQPQVSMTEAGMQDVIEQNAFLSRLFLMGLLEKEMATVEEEMAKADMLERKLAQEEADQLSALTRYVGIGYNLLKGSPDGDFDYGGIDPEIKTTKAIFDFTYEKKKDAYFADTTVNVPDQVNFQPLSSCSKQNRANAYSGAKSYQKSLNFGVDAGVSLFGFRFGLSAAVKKANEETANKKRVYLDHKNICNYGRVEYLSDARGVHKLSKPFYDRVKRLSLTYNLKSYAEFFRDWGTHFIVRADIGTKNITRFSYTYTGVYQLLKKQGSGGTKVGGNYMGHGGSLDLNISAIKVNSRNSSKFAEQSSSFVTGTEKKPFPIHLTLRNITEALKPHYWTALPEKGATYESLSIARKMENMQRALEDYADYEGVRTLRDPVVNISYAWPNGEYALPATTGNCPAHWNQGKRTQGTGSGASFSSRITDHLGVEIAGESIVQRYCVKENMDGDRGIGFEWPEGTYCIARSGGSCPETAFREGSITWNDYKSPVTRKSANSRWGVLPDGTYDKDTKIFYCCRSDGPASKPMLLPVADPFVLYRYGGTCQEVIGARVEEYFIQYEDPSRAFTKNDCTGEHPDDDNCKGNHKLHFCYYGRK